VMTPLAALAKNHVREQDKEAATWPELLMFHRGLAAYCHAIRSATLPHPATANSLFPIGTKTRICLAHTRRLRWLELTLLPVASGGYRAVRGASRPGGRTRSRARSKSPVQGGLAHIGG